MKSHEEIEKEAFRSLKKELENNIKVCEDDYEKLLLEQFKLKIKDEFLFQKLGQGTGKDVEHKILEISFSLTELEGKMKILNSQKEDFIQFANEKNIEI